MSEEPIRRPGRGIWIVASVGAIALIPPVLLVTTGLFGLAVTLLMSNPVIAIAGIAVLLFVSVGAQTRWRAEANRDGIRMEVDLRLRYRGPHHEGPAD